jgi:hypothetical protein
MAQTGYTPISIYYSATSTNTPTAGNLVAGELAINTADGKLFYKDSAGVVQVIGTKGGVGTSSTTQVLYNNAGTVAGSANLIFNGTNLGLGISPNASWSNFSVIQLGGNTYNAVASSNSYMGVYANTYYDGTNFKYVATAGASNYTQNGGAHYFSSASSGTAGNNITFTQTLAIGKAQTLALEGGTQTSGTGIAFPATQSASSDANTLDDYEEGSFTGELRGSTTRATVPVTTNGYYTKIGKQVTVTICFFGVSTVGASGDMQITGLPFATGGTANDMRFSGPVQSYGLAIPAAYNCADVNGGGSTTINFQSFTNNGNWQNVAITAGVTKFLITTFTYFV